MTGRRPGLYWRLTWKVVSPLLLLTIFVAYVAVLARAPLSYRAWDAQYVRPLGARPFPGATLRDLAATFAETPGRWASGVPWGVRADSGRGCGPWSVGGGGGAEQFSNPWSGSLLV